LTGLATQLPISPAAPFCGVAMAASPTAAPRSLPVLLAAPPTAQKVAAQQGKQELSAGAACCDDSIHAAEQPRRMKSETSEMHRKAIATRSTFKRPAIWVMVFGWSLAMCAGFVNAVAFRSWGVYVSHVTGDTTSIGMRIEGYHAGREDFFPLGLSVAILSSFIIGAFLCGMLIDKNQVHFGGKSFYGIALVGNAALLIISLLMPRHQLAACFAAAACGLQNAMCTSHFGAIVRTTHVTGTVTDIGSTSGRIAMIFLRSGFRLSSLNVVERAEVAVDARKLLVLLPMWVFYLSGTVFGAYLETVFKIYALLLPAFITLSVGLVYMFFRQQLKGYMKRVERERLSNDLQDMQTTMERTQAHLKNLRSNSQTQQDGECDDDELVIDLDEEVGNMLETMQDVEANVMGMCHGAENAPEPPEFERAQSAIF